jgi:hypothetical protein
VIGAKATGTDPAYIGQMRTQGLPAGNPDQVIESRVLFHGKKAGRAPPVAPAVSAAAATAVVINGNGLVARGADGSRVAISRSGFSAQGADGSSVSIGAPSDDDEN